MNFVMESKVAIIHRERDVCSGSDNHPWEDVMKVQIIIHWKILAKSRYEYHPFCIFGYLLKPNIQS
jgi:hypothetical protein